MADQMIERDGAPWIAGALPRGDRHQFGEHVEFVVAEHGSRIGPDTTMRGPMS